MGEIKFCYHTSLQAVEIQKVSSCEMVPNSPPSTSITNLYNGALYLNSATV